MNNQQKVTPGYETLKVRPQTMALLREIKEASGETLLHIIHRLAMADVRLWRVGPRVVGVDRAEAGGDETKLIVISEQGLEVHPVYHEESLIERARQMKGLRESLEKGAMVVPDLRPRLVTSLKRQR